jgi:hypothetical protein
VGGVLEGSKVFKIYSGKVFELMVSLKCAADVFANINFK